VFLELTLRDNPHFSQNTRNLLTRLVEHLTNTGNNLQTLESHLNIPSAAQRAANAADDARIGFFPPYPTDRSAPFGSSGIQYPSMNDVATNGRNPYTTVLIQCWQMSHWMLEKEFKRLLDTQQRDFDANTLHLWGRERAMRLQILTLQRQVNDLNAALTANAGGNVPSVNSLSPSRRQSFVFTAKGAYTVIRQRIEWRKITSVKGNFGDYRPKEYRDNAHLLMACENLHNESMTEDPLSQAAQLTSSLMHGDATAFKDGIDDYTIDQVMTNTHYPAKITLWNVPDPTTFDDPDGTFGTFIATEGADTLIQDNVGVNSGPLLDFSVRLDSNKLAGKIVQFAVLVGGAALLATGVPEALVGIAIGVGALQTIGKKAVQQVSKELTKATGRAALGKFSSADVTLATVNGRSKIIGENGAVTFAFSYPKNTDPWAVQPTFEGTPFQIWGPPIELKHYGSAGNAVIGVITIGTTRDAKDFWMARITNSVGYTEKDLLGNDLEAEFEMSLPIGLADLNGANVIKVNGIPIVGNIGGVWELYSHNGSTVTVPP
jgi:hypothetical protein